MGLNSYQNVRKKLNIEYQMKEETNIRGYIESFKDGFIRGWVEVSPDLDRANNFDLYIDGKFISCVEAKIYREDLKDAAVRSGVAGFLTPVPISFCDGEVHLVEIHACASELLINSKELKLTRNKRLLPLDENIVFDQINKAHKKHKKLFILAGFSNQSQLLNYQKHFIETFRKADFYVVYIVASDNPENLTGFLGVADRVIVRRNLGYDFGSWATAVQICQQELLIAEEIICANDSIIGPITSIVSLLKKINQSNTDIWAITDSQDRKYHFQSYFWGIKKKSGHYLPLLDAFFYYRQALPEDKDEAINDYEIQALSFFKDQGASVDILFPESSLVPLAESRFHVDLQEYSEKWQTLNSMRKAGDANIVNEHVLNLANIFINRNATNSSHMYWNELVSSGFPFVKRELITLNPANYPFPYQFRQVFEEHKASYLLDDLATAFKLTRVI